MELNIFLSRSLKSIALGVEGWEAVMSRVV